MKQSHGHVRSLSGLPTAMNPVSAFRGQPSAGSRLTQWQLKRSTMYFKLSETIPHIANALCSCCREEVHYVSVVHSQQQETLCSYNMQI